MQIVSDIDLIEPTENNKDIIEKLKQDQENRLKDINYAIDLNTGNIKQNTHTALIVGNIYPTDKTRTIHNELYEHYLDNMQEYKKAIQKYKTKTIKSIKSLQKNIYDFNILFDRDYYNGFNLRIKDLSNDNIKSWYIEQRASIYAQIQCNSIRENDIKAFIECDIHKLVKSKKQTILLKTADLIKVQQQMSKLYDAKDIDKNITNLYNIIYDIVLELLTIEIQNDITANREYYSKIHSLYQSIDQDIKEILTRFNKIAIDLNSSDDSVEIQQPSVKKLPLLVPTIFNNTYIGDRYSTIYTTPQLTLKVMLELDIKLSDFRENIIFYDNLTNKRIDLLPIDYAIFIACTELNATNQSLSGIRGNIPITIDSIVQYIADNDKLYNTKKRQKKLYEYIQDRLLLYKSCLVDAVYVKNGETKKLYSDPIPILHNTHFNDPFNDDIDSYIIGASAILTIIAKIEDIEGRTYLASYTKAREYINDNQNNTIETLNIKYYILPKILQQMNSKSKGEVYNPQISLQDMYKSLALLKGKDKLSRQEEKRARDTAFTFMESLKTKKLLQAYDTKPLADKNSKKQPIVKANTKIEYIYTKPNYKGEKK